LKQYFSYFDAYQIRAAKELEVEPFCLDIPGLGIFTLHPTGHRPYKYILKNPEIGDIRVVSEKSWDKMFSGQTGQLYISLRSKFLQYRGLAGIFEVQAALDSFFDYDLQLLPGAENWDRVSRLDLAADIAGISLGYDDLPNFRSRGRNRNQYPGERTQADKIQELIAKISEPCPPGDNKGHGKYVDASTLDEIRDVLNDIAEVEGGELTRTVSQKDLQTAYFGSFKSPAYARLYDKLASLKPQNKEYMKDIWASKGWDGESSVWRVEFSISGKFLKNAGNLCSELGNPATGEVGAIDLRELVICLDSIDALWHYFTHDWLFHGLPIWEADTNRNRLQLSDFWLCVQSAFPENSGLFRCESPPNPNHDQLMAQVRGCLLTLASIRMVVESDSQQAFWSLMEEFCAWSGEAEWGDDLLERRWKLGLDDGSLDLMYSAEIRRQRMRHGEGS
jgi:hypothetical protein